MNEANQNANSFAAESLWHEQANRSAEQHDNSQSLVSQDGAAEPEGATPASASSAAESAGESSTATMNWQRVAHKLREYNRKLLKKVFRLEQELAEIDNKFDKSIEKSKNSDLLLVQQAEDIEGYQEKIAVLVEQLAGSQQQLDNQELIIKQISEQHDLSQQQSAQLERECTLLQEKYNQKAFEVVAKEKESQELQSELSQQQHLALQQSAKLKRYQEAADRKEKASSRNQNYPHNRFIQPWSHGMSEPKIALPKTKLASPAAIAKKNSSPAETTKTAAEIATWSVNTTAPKAERTTSKISKSSSRKKPQSLAAVDLPTFPRPN